MGNLPCWMWSRAGGRRLQQGRLCFLQLNLGGSVLCREGRTSSVWRHQKNGQRWNIILGFQVGGCGPSTPVAGRRAPAPTALPSQQSPFRKPRNAGMILCSDAGAAGKQLLFHSFFFHQSFCRALWEPEARHRNCSDSSADKTKLFYIFLWTF